MDIKTNCELPLCLMEKNNELNDYDFVLFHLYKENKQYKEYFLNQREQNPDRLMILDNSAYEFYVKGETLNLYEFYCAIVELKPDIYILPDTLMNKQKTLEDTKSFYKKYGLTIVLKTRSLPMAVLQGNTPEELLECANISAEFDHKMDHLRHSVFSPFLKLPDDTEFLNDSKKSNS
jgi:hypothetical protein